MTAPAHMQTPEAYAAYYDGRALYKERRRQCFGRTRMRYFRPERGQSILDLGCGSGGNMMVFGQWCPVVGVELAQDLVDIMQREITARGAERPPAEVHQGWIEKFDDPRRFDHVLLTEVMEHVIDPVAILKVARRHLAPGGQVYISSPGIKTGGDSHVRGVPFSDLSRWLEAADLEVLWHTEQPNKTGGQSYPQTVCKAVATCSH